MCNPILLNDLQLRSNKNTRNVVYFHRKHPVGYFKVINKKYLKTYYGKEMHQKPNKTSDIKVPHEDELLSNTSDFCRLKILIEYFSTRLHNL